MPNGEKAAKAAKKSYIEDPSGEIVLDPGGVVVTVENCRARQQTIGGALYNHKGEDAEGRWCYRAD